MSDQALAPASSAPAPEAHHDDPMSHVPPGSLWPFLVMIGLVIAPFGVLSVLGALKTTAIAGPLADERVGIALILVASLIFAYSLMGWAHQIISEKRIAHDVVQQQKDLQLFILLFLCGEAAAFGAIFGYYYHRQLHDVTFGPIPGQRRAACCSASCSSLLPSSLAWSSSA